VAPPPRPPDLTPRLLALVLVGGCAGGLARHLLGAVLGDDATSWPWGVLGANTAGAFLLGLLLGGPPRSAEVRALVGTGFCGAFTTMSALAVLAVDGATGAGFAATSAVLGLAAAALGVALVRTEAGR
jgi:CrcB protein